MSSDTESESTDNELDGVDVIEEEETDVSDDEEYSDASDEEEEIPAPVRIINRSEAEAFKPVSKQPNLFTAAKYIVPPNERRMRPILSPSMLSMVISKRVALLCTDPTVYVDTTGMSDPIKIAFKELLARCNPLIIECDVGNDWVEQWSPNEMEINVPISIYDPSNLN